MEGAFGAGAVVVDAQEGIDVVEEVLFEAAKAHEAPGGVNGLVGEEDFEGSGGAKLGGEGEFVGFELFGLRGRDEGVFAEIGELHDGLLPEMGRQSLSLYLQHSGRSQEILGGCSPFLFRDLLILLGKKIFGLVVNGGWGRGGIRSKADP
jgi:hypothetical protein